MARTLAQPNSDYHKLPTTTERHYGGKRMPLSKSGKKVMSSMRKTYGTKKGKSVFYATAKKRGMKKWHKDSMGEVKGY